MLSIELTHFHLLTLIARPAMSSCWLESPWRYWASLILLNMFNTISCIGTAGREENHGYVLEPVFECSFGFLRQAATQVYTCLSQYKTDFLLGPGQQLTPGGPRNALKSFLLAACLPAPPTFPISFPSTPTPPLSRAFNAMQCKLLPSAAADRALLSASPCCKDNIDRSPALAVRLSVPCPCSTSAASEAAELAWRSGGTLDGVSANCCRARSAVIVRCSVYGVAGALRPPDAARLLPRVITGTGAELLEIEAWMRVGVGGCCPESPPSISSICIDPCNQRHADVLTVRTLCCTY